MLFQAHMGKEKDVCSLERWIREIRRDKQKIWNRQKEIVREFRQSQSFFDIVLDGHLVAAIAHLCGYPDVTTFADGLAEMDADLLKKSIEELAKTATDFAKVKNDRLTTEKEQRDLGYEKHLLFMQHGLVLRNLALAMRDGDSGRVLVSLGYLTVWFQATDKFNYAYETLHMMACVRRLWSPRMKEFWMKNCLVNMSGKERGFMACDQLCEHVVREVKDMMHHNVDDKTAEWLRNTLSPQILSFYLAKERMREETGAIYDSGHSSKTTTKYEVETIAARILEDQLCHSQPGRISNERESPLQDLHGDGLWTLGQTTRISKYMERVRRDIGMDYRKDWEDAEQAQAQAQATESENEEVGPLDGEEAWLDDI